ncbi:proton-conducting transporter transmembrane domain-containing protein [Planctomicrobium piriforme]|uniref:Probable inorganic carbon transporter subunit DabB n=1 Tax=Planctomicrobium piriforme TaxID=1576369 RepID=A0A1I3SGB0_9PLAN|nr:proton-conducting transporter membrane subunit [Planctomicrobium piriforme]SFJ57420.1 NAD(P)H-quinone oxidoreductase subunit 5 [Planctomicrobium piriforme]
MHFWFSLTAAAPPLLLLACGLVPSRWADRHLAVMRRASVGLALLAFALSVTAGVLLAIAGPLDSTFVQWSRPIPLSLGVYVDSLSAIMLVLISFIGLIVVRFSIRYLDGDARQGRFLRWMSFTIGAALLLVVARNLVLFTLAWTLTSLGLHRLLKHYPERSWALWAARKKFLISRLGDLLLLAALVLTFQCFGTFEYGEIFAAAQAIHAGSSAGSPLIPLIGVLFVLGAMTKSAQFPFHSWLPDTMETPTPVSALMHAGIINAGGFLVIRLSPLIALSHAALDFLALTGAFTALFGGLVMLTQTSIKRSLAYSTIAQMGFMMLQCGLGAFSAALLHIVAHSAYKAHAFLTCGSVLESAARLRNGSFPTQRGIWRLAMLPLAIAIAVGLYAFTFQLLGIDVAAKSGGPVLGLVMTIALTQLVWTGLSAGTWGLAARGLFSATLVCGAYAGSYLLIDSLFAGSKSHILVPASSLDMPVIVLVAAGFTGIFALQSVTASFARAAWLRALYVHAMNGFYIDIPARRITARFWRQSAPVQ